jgi:colanic acid/amylovoran biosynthesis glycosyltransferase
MKIAVIISEFPSLNETFILDHITGLIDRRLDVDVYATSPRSESKIHDEVNRYDLPARAIYRDHRKFAMPHNRGLRVLKATKLIAQGLLNSPLGTVNSLNLFRLGRTAMSLTALYSAAPFITNTAAYDIIHCHFLDNGELAVAMRDTGILKGKIITQLHGYNRPLFQNGEVYRLYPTLFTKGDLFLTGSEHSKRFYDDQIGWKKDRMIVHRYSVRTDLFDVSRHRSKLSSPIRVLSVGRLVEKKGFRYGMLAMAQVIQRFPDVSYEIAGDGPLKESLEQLIAELDAGGRIRLLGWQNRTEVLGLLREADIFLAPHVTSADGDQETGPVVLLEAMGMGLPVVSTRHTGIPEFICDGESGFLVAENDVDALADRVIQLLKNPDRWHAMGQKGRRRIEEYHNLDKQTDRLIRIYRHLSNGEQLQPAVMVETSI